MTLVNSILFSRDYTLESVKMKTTHCKFISCQPFPLISFAYYPSSYCILPIFYVHLRCLFIVIKQALQNGKASHDALSIGYLKLPH